MATFDVLSQTGEKLRTIELSDSIFGLEAAKEGVEITEKHIRPYLWWEVVKSQLAGRRSGSANTKTRSEVRGGGAKPFRQKGTGRARQGSIRSYHWVGGGTCHGPKPRSWAQDTPKQVKRMALCSALSQRVLDKKLLILDSLALSEAKTKKALGLLKAMKVSGKVLFVDKEAEDQNHVPRNLSLSVRNTPDLNALAAGGLNVFDVLRHETVIISEQAARWIEGALKK
jgi:large subunit ribosomal protein L4